MNLLCYRNHPRLLSNNIDKCWDNHFKYFNKFIKKLPGRKFDYEGLDYFANVLKGTYFPLLH